MFPIRMTQSCVTVIARMHASAASTRRVAAMFSMTRTSATVLHTSNADTHPHSQARNLRDRIIDRTETGRPALTP